MHLFIDYEPALLCKSIQIPLHHQWIKASITTFKLLLLRLILLLLKILLLLLPLLKLVYFPLISFHGNSHDLLIIYVFICRIFVPLVILVIVVTAFVG